MDIKTLDLKTKLMAGTVLAVISGFVPPVANTASAGTATIGANLELVTAITLTGTTALDFGRIAITGGGPVAGVHVLDSTGAVATQAGSSAMVGATEAAGSFNITGGVSAANVTAVVSAAVSYDGGDILVDQLIFGGPGLAAPVVVAAGGTGTLIFGGGSTDVQVGGRITFSGTPAVGAYNTLDFTVTVTDIP
jgi:hypothetical protein